MAWFLNNYVEEKWAWATVFSAEECQQIIKIGESLSPTDGVLDDGSVKHELRKSKTAWINHKNYRWIYEKITAPILEVNNKFFNFDLTFVEELQFTKYGPDKDYYCKHTDNGYTSFGPRKLSFSILLSDPEHYSGGDLALHYEAAPIYGKRMLGVMTVFPSFMLHEVTPVTSGTRYSLVGWCCGPKLR
jgi:PKHD-type hydroxylase